MQGLKQDPALVNLPEWFLAHGRHVSRDNLPAMIGKPHPRLALAADQIVSAHLELEVDRGEIAPERQNFEADALCFDAGARRARYPMLVNGLEAVTVLVQRVADGVWAVPERVVEHRDV